jgi:hypothetical protein
LHSLFDLRNAEAAGNRAILKAGVMVRQGPKEQCGTTAIDMRVSGFLSSHLSSDVAAANRAG